MTSRHLHDVVAGVLLRDDRVLLCHRHPNRQWFPNVWDVPGGHIEVDESPSAAVQRELREELGIDVRLDSSEPFRTITPSTELRLQVWIVTEWEGKIENHAPYEHDEIAWFNADELLHIDLTDGQLTGVLLDALELATS